MNFEIGDERRLFAASIDAAATGMPSVVRDWSRGVPDSTRTVFRTLGKIGVTGLLDDDGSAVDVVVALERLGFACCPGPVVETVAVAPVLLRSQPEAADLAAGESLVSVASTTLMPRAVDADVCSSVLLLDGGIARRATVGTTHASVDPARTLVDLHPGPAIDVSDGAVDTAELLGALGTAAYLVGAGEWLLRTTVEYAGVRTQFGKPVGSFQAVAHTLADTMIGLELARPLVLAAALSVDAGSTDAPRDVSAAKVAAGDAAYRASRSALQVHGALGYTAEHDVSLYLTRVRALMSAWGTAAWHRRRVADAIGVS